MSKYLDYIKTRNHYHGATVEEEFVGVGFTKTINTSFEKLLRSVGTKWQNAL